MNLGIGRTTESACMHILMDETKTRQNININLDENELSSI